MGDGYQSTEGLFLTTAPGGFDTVRFVALE